MSLKIKTNVLISQHMENSKEIAEARAEQPLLRRRKKINGNLNIVTLKPEDIIPQNL